MLIRSLYVKNFKSLKELKINCKRVNIFIGKPNTGKSNILESLGMFSFPFSSSLRDLIRFEDMTNLFYDNVLDEKIETKAGDFRWEIEFKDGRFYGKGESKDGKLSFYFDYSFNGEGNARPGNFSPFKFYRFSVLKEFPDTRSDFLKPPNGSNLMTILLTKKSLKKMAADLFKEFGLRIVLKPREGKIEVQKEVEEVIISYPYPLVSDTLQRVLFHLAAIETNTDSILIFEEPEAHAFPFYTKFLAERIAMDRNNQYFISTHNPYLLLSIVEKIPKGDIRVFITYLKDYQTKVKPLTVGEMQEILDMDASIFFNLESFLEEGG
jgi:hypothetical protein